jgi:MFS family permease
LWARWFERVSIIQVSSLVFFFFGLFPALLALSGFGFWWLYVAYLCYGIGQGGSHLVWNMAGPVFAGKEPSLRYTGTGVMLAGLRGAVGPGLGGVLSVLWGPIQVLCVGSILCLSSGFWFLRKSVKSSLIVKR